MEEVIGSIPIRSTKSTKVNYLAIVNSNLNREQEIDRFHGRTIPAIHPS
jgi:hypothetical protein